MGSEVLSELAANRLGDLVGDDMVVMLHFWDRWNESDGRLLTILKDLQSEFGDRVVMRSTNINLAENYAVCREFGIVEVPTLLVFVRGYHVDTIVGLRDPEYFREKLYEWLSMDTAKLKSK